METNFTCSLAGVARAILWCCFFCSAPGQGHAQKCSDPSGSRFYCLSGGYRLCRYAISSNVWTTLTTDFVDQFGNDVTEDFESMTGGGMAMDGSGDLWIVISSRNRYALYLVTAGNLPAGPVASIPVIQLIPPSSSAFTNGAVIDGIAFDPSGRLYLSTQTDLFLLHHDLSTITHKGRLVLKPWDVMDDMACCNFPTVVLPTIWMNFVASKQEPGGVALGWQYGRRVSLGIYSIQRSADCQTWTEIGSKRVLNADSSDVYTFTDDHPLRGKAYYRIRLRMPNVADSYSGARGVDGRPSGSFAISQNPVLNTMTIHYTEKGPDGWAVVYDLTGKTVIVERVSAGANVLSTSGLTSGVYTVEVSLCGGLVHTQKIVKQ